MSEDTTAQPDLIKRGRGIFACLTIILAALALYGGTANYGFLEHDDDRNIYENHRILNPTSANYASYWSEPYLGLYIPVTYTYWTALSGLSHALSDTSETQNEAQKPDPRWFHRGNVILHATNGLLVMMLLRIVGFGLLASTFGALFFVAHPLQVEAVAWASGAKDVWSTFWGLLSLVAFARYLNKQIPHRRLMLCLNYIFYALAILCKPSQVVIPALCALMLYHKESKFSLQRLTVFIPHGVVLSAYLLLANVSQGAEGTFKPVPLALRPLIAGDAINFYASKIILPIDLAVDYARHPYAVINNKGALVLSFLTLVILAVSLVATLVTNKPWLKKTTVVCGMFVVSLVPVLGLVPFGYQFFSTVCDRYAYLAVIAPAWALASMTQGVGARRRAIQIITTLYLLTLSFATAHQIEYWHDETTLFQHSLEVQADGAVALIGRSNELAKKGDWRSTLPLLERASQALPDWARPHNNLGTSFVNLDRYQDAADALAKALKLRPVYPLAWSNRCSVVRQLKRLDEAAHDCKMAVDQAPEFAPAHLNMALTLMDMGNWAGAAASYQKALALDPNNYDSLYFWASALRDRGDYHGAIQSFTKLAALYPRSEEARRELEHTQSLAATGGTAKN